MERVGSYGEAPAVAAASPRDLLAKLLKQYLERGVDPPPGDELRALLSSAFMSGAHSVNHLYVTALRKDVERGQATGEFVLTELHDCGSRITTEIREWLSSRSG